MNNIPDDLIPNIFQFFDAQSFGCFTKINKKMRAFAQGNAGWTAEDLRWKIVESCWENICKNHFLVSNLIDQSWKKAAGAAIK